MANPWFRMYSEFLHDPKVQTMPEPMQLRLVKLMCLRCSEVLDALDADELQYSLRISAEELAATKALFLRKGFIDETWSLVNWEKRQRASDVSTERVSRFREKRRESDGGGNGSNETEVKRERNGSETAPDTDTELEGEKNKHSPAAAPAESRPESVEVSDEHCGLVYAAYPRHIGKSAAYRGIRKAVVHLATGKDLPAMARAAALAYLYQQVQIFAQSAAGQRGEYTPHAATWFNQMRYLDDPKEWEHAGNSANQPGVSGNRGQARANGNREALHRSIQADIDQTVARVDGGGAAGVGERGDVHDLRQGPRIM